MNTKGIFNSAPRLLHDERIRRAVDGQENTLYCAVDVVAALADTEPDTEPAQDLWFELKRREPVVADLVQEVVFPGDSREEDALSLAGVFRVIQSVPSRRAERLRQWLAQAARQRVEEADNPELAILRTQQAYQHQGYDADWISKRLQSIGGRRTLAGEWYRRGIHESDQFRALTNELIQTSFGMDVNTYRRYKGLWRSGQNLRDHMTDLELALVSLGETVAASLHRDRRSNGFEALSADTKDAGAVVADTRAEIERQIGHPVVSAVNHVNYAPRRRSSHGREASRGMSSHQSSRSERPRDVAA